MNDERLVDLKYIIEHIPICRATVYNRVNAGTFPKYRKIGRQSFWLLSEINKLIQDGEGRPSACQDNRPNPA